VRPRVFRALWQRRVLSGETITGVGGGSGKRATSCETLRSEIAAISSALFVAATICCRGDGSGVPRPTPVRRGGGSGSSGDGGVTVMPAMVAAANAARFLRSAGASAICQSKKE